MILLLNWNFRFATLFLRKRHVRRRFVSTPNRRFEFHKSCQLSIRVHNETFSITAMCVSNPDRSPARIDR